MFLEAWVSKYSKTPVILNGLELVQQLFQYCSQITARAENAQTLNNTFNVIQQKKFFERSIRVEDLV